jgi:hypothetical protein
LDQRKGKGTWKILIGHYRRLRKIPSIQWERTDYFDNTTFIKDGLNKTAYCVSDSKLVGITSHKKYAALPAEAQKSIDIDYPGCDKREVIFFDDNELNETDMIVFGNQFEDADNYFVDLKTDNRQIV